MTTLYLVRHAIAEDPSDGLPDEDRQLTDKGRRKFRKAARGLTRLLGKHAISHILTSPLVRARQTAEILATAITKHGGTADVAVLAALGNAPDLEALIAAARAVKPTRDQDVGVAAVGHNPTFAEWIGQLCFQKQGELSLDKGAVAAIRLADDGPRGELLWLAPPSLLRQL